IVYLPGPFVGAGRLEGADDLDADNRTAAFARVDIVLVDLGPAGLGVVRLLERNDGGAQRTAAVGHAHSGLAAVGQPAAGRIGGEHGNGGEEGGRETGRAQGGHGG